MEYTSENLERAVSLFYRVETGYQAEAHHWLTEAQNSPQAWSFVWELLNPLRDYEVQFYAATTLHTKLMKHWAEVPTDHYELLKKRILEAIISYAMGPKIVLNRLCITLSAYIIHTVPDHWPNAFEELVSSFQPQHLPNVEPERVIWILLEILTVIPEEFQSTSLLANQRSRVREVLQTVSKDILKVVEMCLLPVPSAGFDMSNLTTYLNAARCAGAWIQLGGLNIDECGSVITLLINLTCFTYFNKLDPEGLSSEELELCEVMVEALASITQHPQASRYPTYVIKHTADILDKFEKILECEVTSPEPNKDIVTSLYGLIVSMGDIHSKIFIGNLKSDNVEIQKISFAMFNAILKCSSLPGVYPNDELSSSITFGFWYTLQDDIISLETAECAQLLLLVKPYYRDLVCIMLKKAMFPLDVDRVFTLDDKEVFRCYRQDVADTFIYCYNVLNLEMLDILHTRLSEALHKASTEPAAVQWNEVETCLHAYGAIAESIELENLYLPKLMVALKEIPYQNLHRKVMTAALETVGSYSDWITEHPEMLQNVLPLVISALDRSEVSMSSTMALKDLTHSCQKYLLPYADHILMAAQHALQGGNLKLGECTRLMYSIGKVLSILPVPRIMEYLNIILAPSFKELQELLSVEYSDEVKTPLITNLKIISALFNSMCVKKELNSDVMQPSVVVMQNTMDLYKMIAENYCNSSEVIRELSSLLKHVVTTLQDDCMPLINDLLQIVVTVYRNCPQSTILEVAKTVMIMFGKDVRFRSITHQLLHEIVGTTLQLCAKYNSTNQLSEKTDVLEGFFFVMAQLYKKIPHVVFESGIDNAALFQCAVICLGLPEIQTLKYCGSFLVNFITQSREIAQTSVVQTYGESLVLRILMNIGATTPRTCVEVFSDLLLALSKKYCDNLSRWLNTLLAQADFPSPKITQQQKEHFINVVLREKANKRRLLDTVLEFTLICRGILREDPSLA